MVVVVVLLGDELENQLISVLLSVKIKQPCNM